MEDMEQIDRDVILAIYSLMLTHGLTMAEIHDMMNNDRIKLELLTYRAVSRQTPLQKMATTKLLTVVARTIDVLYKYCGAFGK